MNGLKRLALICALMTAAVAGMTATAQASRAIGVSPGGTMTSSGIVTFTGSGLNIICTLNLTETVNRSINKVVGAVASSTTAASMTGCNLGITATFLFGTPWAGTYSSFTGTLPNITEINGEVANGGMQLTIPAIGANCLYVRGFRWKWLYRTWIAIRRLTWLWVLFSGVNCPPTLTGGGDLTTAQRHTLALI